MKFDSSNGPAFDHACDIIQSLVPEANFQSYERRRAALRL